MRNLQLVLLAAALATSCTSTLTGTGDVTDGVTLPRLSHVQYARTAQAFLGLPTTPTLALRPDTAPEAAYATDYRGRLVDETLLRQYRGAADQLTDALLADGAAYANFIATAGEGDVATRLRTLITAAWPRAYRRQLTPDEITRLVALGQNAPDYPAAGDDEARLRSALGVLLRATFQSPYFIYRVELGDATKEIHVAGVTQRPLSATEYATRLAYVLFDAPPDAGLLSRTAELESADSRKTLVTEMVADPRASATLLEFHRALYVVDESRGMRKDEARFPGSAGLGADAATEAERFLRSVVDDGGGVRELLLSRKGFVNTRLAAIYGVTADGADANNYVPVELPAERPGILTRVSWLGAQADLFEKNSIHRGVFVGRKILCETIGAAPPGAAATLPTPPPELVTNRQRVGFRTDACGPCHTQQINPLGYAFENYDAVGAYVTTEGPGATIDASGTFPLDGTARPYTDARSFLGNVAEARQTHACYARNLAAWLLGRPLVDADTPDIEAAAADSQTAAASVRAIVTDLVTSPSFLSVTLEDK